MFKRLSKKTKIIISLLINVVIINASLVLATYNLMYAWFSSNKEVTAQNMAVKSYGEDIDIDVSIYKCDPTTFIPVTTDSDNGNAPWDLDNLTFLTYDTIFKARNVYTPILVRLGLSGEYLDDEGTINLTITHDSSFDGDGSKLSQYFSSIIRFTCAIDDEIYSTKDNGDIKDGGVSKTWENAVGYIKGNEDDYDTAVFPQKNNDVWEKEESIILSQSYTSDDWKTINGVKTLNVYLFMDYEDSEDGLIDSFIKESDIKVDSLHNNLSVFENDITSIYVDKA